jgi:hypothetical protein
MLWLNWGPCRQRPQMSFSVEDDTYIALYGASAEAAGAQEIVGWATERMREMEPLASGIQLADENLGRRRARFLGAEQTVRLQQIRARYDSEGLFHSWMDTEEAKL